MQVPKINAYLKAFPAWMKTDEALAHLPVWETQKNWQAHFNVEAKDLAESYDRALDSKTNRRHYRRSGYDPKAAMLKLMVWEPDFVRDAFRDLYSEDRQLEGRVQRFVFYVNELFNRFRDQHPKDHLPSHYHDDDYNMVSLYLMGQYPETYAPYATTTLMLICARLGAREIPPAADFPRYTKLLKTLRNFLTKDEAIMATYNATLREQDYQDDSALLVWWWFQMIVAEDA